MRKTLLSFLLFCFGIAAAQAPATGNYPFSTYDLRGFDSVNVGNLNVRFNIPITSRTGRGLPFNYSLQYEGLVWSAVGGTWVPDPTFGFQGLLNGTGLKGYLTFQTTQRSCPRTGAGGGGIPVSRYFGYVYHDEFGIAHHFNYSDQEVCNSADTITGDGSATDNSGYKLNVNDTSQVLTRSGSVITPAQSATGQDPTSLVDSNGNQINGNGSGGFTDTLGVTALSISGSSPRVFNYPVTRQANGATTASTTLSYRTYTVRTNFQCSVGEYGSTSTSLPDRVTLADGSFYAFTYEGTAGATDGAVTGRLASVTLPTGGTISYAYTAGCGAGMNPDGSVGSMTRTTSDGTRTYTRAPINGNATSTTVQDEKGNQTSYSFTIDSASQRYLETHRTVHQGNTSGPVLQDQYTCYNGAAANCDGGAVTLPVSEADVTVSYNGGTQTLTKNSYDTNGSLLLSSAMSSGGTTLMTHSNAYNGLGEITASGDYIGPNATPSSANCIDYSAFSYDEGTPTATSGVPQHGAAGGSRGNLTTAIVTASGTNLVTSYTYYDTGVPLNSTAPDGGVTGYVYDATQAFVTATNLPTPSSGVALSTSAQYDPGTTALLSSTGMNSGETTTVNQYDALMQPIDITLPSGSHITTPRNDVNWKFWRQTLDANRSAASEKQLDAYGRVSRVDQESGGSPDWYQADYCYDATGLLQFQSTPYAGTGMLQPNGSASAKHCSGSGTSSPMTRWAGSPP